MILAGNFLELGPLSSRAARGPRIRIPGKLKEALLSAPSGGRG
jgi:hypothetical protein